MSDDNPQLTLARAVGRLEGVIGELSDEIKGLRTDMKDKVDEKQSIVIAQAQVSAHEDRLHKKDSIAPAGVSIRISKSVLAKIGIWVAGIGGGGFGAWSLIEKLINN